VDLDPNRVELAERFGIQAVIREQAEEAALSFTGGQGFDAILICADTSANDPVELAGMIARDRAHVVAVGAVGQQLPRKIYYEKELTFLNSRSYGPGRYDPGYEEGGLDYPVGYVRWTEGRNLEAFVSLLAAGRLDVMPLITHRFTIDEAPQAYALITGKLKQPFLAVLLTYPAGGAEDASQALESGSVNIESLSVTSPVALAEPTSGGPIRLGVLGAGNFAVAVMLPALKSLPGIQLVGVASASGMNARHAAGRFGFSYADSDENRIIQDPQINTIAVLTRHNLHARQVIAALQAGKHVFCEKPLALSTGELEDIRAALENPQQNVPHALLTVGFNRRFAPLARTMKDFLDSRSEPLYASYRVNAGYIPLSHWTHDPEQGGGRIIGEACHFIDFLSFLVGSAPVSVNARGLPDGGRYREDNVILTFGFPDGSLGLVSYLANGDKAFPKERIEAFASGRVAVLDDFRSLELTHSGKRRIFRSRLRQDKGHRAEWEAFSASIRSSGPPSIPYDQLFGVMQAAIAAVEALRASKV
jgi:predicted dehydrogenase